MATVLSYVLGGLIIFVSLVIVVLVLFQSSKKRGLSGAIAGAADTYMTKNKAKSLDAKLAKMTKWVAVVFVVLTLALNMLG